MALGFGKLIQGFVAQRRVAGALFEILQQFAGEMRLLWKLGAAHHL